MSAPPNPPVPICHAGYALLFFTLSTILFVLTSFHISLLPFSSFSLLSSCLSSFFFVLFLNGSKVLLWPSSKFPSYPFSIIPIMFLFIFFPLRIVLGALICWLCFTVLSFSLPSFLFLIFSKFLCYLFSVFFFVILFVFFCVCVLPRGVVDPPSLGCGSGGGVVHPPYPWMRKWGGWFTPPTLGCGRGGRGVVDPPPPLDALA